MSDFFPELVPKVGEETNWPMGDASALVYQQKIRYWMEAAFEEAKYELAQNEEINEVDKYIDYMMGKQWPGGRPSYKSRPVNNRIWRQFWELVALLTDLKPVFSIAPTIDKYQDIAISLNKLTRSWWLENDADLALSQVVVYAILTTGYAKLEWDGSLRNGQGDQRMIPLGGKSLLLLKPQGSIASAQACIYQAIKPVNWVKRKYPFRQGVVTPDMALSSYTVPEQIPNGLSPLMYSQLSPQMKYKLGKGATLKPSAYPMCLYREFWIQDSTINSSNKMIPMGSGTWKYVVKPGEPLYPRGRLVVMAGREPVHDGPNPYWHGTPPFSALRMNVVPWQWAGLSELRALVPLQDIVNNIFAGVMDMVKKAVNPGFLAPKNAFSDQFWNSLDWSMPGAKGAYNPTAAHQPQFTPAPQLPGFVLQMLTIAMREMDQSSGLAAISEAVRKNQVPGADTLDQIKQTQQTPIRLKGRHIETFLRDLGTQSIANMFQFYTSDRMAITTGMDNSGLPKSFNFIRADMMPNGMKPEEMVRNFIMYIQPGSILNTDRQTELQTLIALRKNKDIDRQTLLEKLNIGLDPTVIAQRLQQEMSAMPQPPGRPQ